MTLSSTIRRLLATLMVVGLVLAPLSRPVMAGAMSDAAMQAMADVMSASMAADDMAEMPCCPAQAPAPADCDKCVYMAGCAPTFLTGMPTSVVLPLPIASDSVARLTNDFRPDGFGRPPPEHPPRILV